MKLKSWTIVMLVASLFLLGHLPANRSINVTSSASLASDSFIQVVGDCYIWEYMICRNMSLSAEEGARIKADVTVVNTTDAGGGVYVDGVYGNMSIWAPSSPVWILLPMEISLGMYMYVSGVPGGQYYPGMGFIVPQNLDAVNVSFSSKSMMGLTFEYFNWTNYDLPLEMWNGSADGTGEIFDKKLAAKFNDEGVLQCYQFYNSTGTSWELTDEMVLQTPLKPVLQSPIQSGTNVSLTWNVVTNASTYYIYRSGGSITQQSWKNMTPLGQTSASSYTDQNMTNGTYYYAVVAGNIVANSSISANQQITVVILPEEPEPGISGFAPGLLVTSFVILVVIWWKRRRSVSF
ncbi:MAG: hypothetical protein RBG13Loki_1604 [Promethearchaeota archaeon CR_4]|nr:MAG: hypothetical protein RBG13Loki_1604 [Candidatus Lokiarchaeota archaeon CR_4]